MATNIKKPPQPNHMQGTNKGEERVQQKGKEPGRHTEGKYYRTARDSTSVAAHSKGPIDPRMPSMPPA